MIYTDPETGQTGEVPDGLAFDPSKQCQDEYCASCWHYQEGFCNVILKPLEICGDYIEADGVLPESIEEES